MEYVVSTENKVCDKGFGEKVTEQELLDAGANIEALLAAGSVTKATSAPQVRQAPQVSDFKSINNNEGDK